MRRYQEVWRAPTTTSLWRASFEGSRLRAGVHATLRHDGVRACGVSLPRADEQVIAGRLEAETLRTGDLASVIFKSLVASSYSKVEKLVRV